MSESNPQESIRAGLARKCWAVAPFVVLAGVGIVAAFALASDDDRPEEMVPVAEAQSAVPSDESTHGVTPSNIGADGDPIQRTAPAVPYPLSRKPKTTVNRYEIFWMLNILGIGLVWRDLRPRMAERERAEEAMHRQHTKLKAMMSSMEEGVVFADTDDKVVEANSCFCRLLGVDQKDILGKKVHTLFEEGDLSEKIERQTSRYRAEFTSESLSLQCPLNGVEVICRCHAIYQIGVYDGMFVNLVDVTELVKAREEAEKASQQSKERAEQLEAAHEALRKEALHDSLTGLLNRPAILEMLQKELSRAEREGSSVGVLVADIDLFKRINDTQGHKAGDVVLCKASDILQANLREYDSIGRYGGEEFLVVMPGCDLADAARRAETLRAKVACGGIEVEGRKVSLSISVGAAASCEHERPDTDTLIQTADVAMYRAKRAGRNRVATAKGAALVQ